MVVTGGTKMTQVFENPKVEKLNDETISNATKQERVEKVADKAAEKPAKSEQHYDKNNNKLFSK
jgi:uncharacterized protein YmfQ (DUF2313 family)